MPSAFVGVGLDYNNTMPGCAADANNMADLAASMGIDNINTFTDAGGSAVTCNDVLGALRNMVNNAQPGDNLIFSFSGMAGQAADATGAEADGQNEFLQLSDGAITDDQIREILAGLPEGANLTMAFDASSSGTMADLDLSGCDIAGNVVTLSAAADGADAFSGDASGSPFTNALIRVMQQNEGISFADAAAAIDAELGVSPDSPMTVASANRPELLFEPAFNSEPAAADDHDAARAGQHPGNVVTLDQNQDGIDDYIAVTTGPGRVVEQGIDADQDGYLETITNRPDITTNVTATDADASGTFERLEIVNYGENTLTTTLIDADEDGIIDSSRIVDAAGNVVDDNGLVGQSMNEALDAFNMNAVADDLQTKFDEFAVTDDACC
ncbi:hypothetical protein H9P43_000428 [Blastocladiella emersonii ATCC 22665]|nr:hypothetical protein H9P43_000428 [Blastocladiella emersonii ATCC 22665]